MTPKDRAIAELLKDKEWVFAPGTVGRVNAEGLARDAYDAGQKAAKPRIEIFHFEMPHPQAYIDQPTGSPRIGGTPGEVKVRLAGNHGVWEASRDLRLALKALMRSCKIIGLPCRIDQYDVVFADTVRCDAFAANGEPYERPQPVEAV